MNKKAYLKHSIFSVFSLFIIVIVLSLLIPIQERVLTKEEAISRLNWENFTSSQDFKVSDENDPVVNIVYKFVDATIYSAMEIAKLGVIWGTDNLHISAKTLALLLIFAIISPIFLNLVKLTLITIIFVKDLIAGKKEKRELNQMRAAKK